MSHRYKVLSVSLLAFSVAAATVLGSQNEAGNKPMPLDRMVEAIQQQPLLADQSFYYDDGFRAIGSFAVHDHFGKRTCIGYLVTDGKKLAYRYIRAMPGLGSSNDAFETELSNGRRIDLRSGD